MVIYLNSKFKGGSIRFLKYSSDNVLWEVRVAARAARASYCLCSHFYYSLLASQQLWLLQVESYLPFIIKYIQVKPETGLCMLFQHDLLHEGTPTIPRPATTSTTSSTGDSPKYLVRTDIVYVRNKRKKRQDLHSFIRVYMYAAVLFITTRSTSSSQTAYYQLAS